MLDHTTRVKDSNIENLEPPVSPMIFGKSVERSPGRDPSGHMHTLVCSSIGKAARTPSNTIEMVDDKQ